MSIWELFFEACKLILQMIVIIGLPILAVGIVVAIVWTVREHKKGGKKK